MKLIQIKGLSVLAGVTVGLFLLSYLLLHRHPAAAPWTILAASLHSMAAFWALTWAVTRSNRAFFSIFIGDALLRLVVLAVVTLWLQALGLSVIVPLLALAAAYLVMSLIQIPFLMQVR